MFCTWLIMVLHPMFCFDLLDCLSLTSLFCVPRIQIMKTVLKGTEFIHCIVTVMLEGVLHSKVHPLVWALLL